MDQQTIELELRQRAQWHALQPRLMVDYYRIRRRVSFPLPVTTAREPAFPTALSAAYPWNIWMVWALEERINALAWSAEHEHDAVHCTLAESQLYALAHWPSLSRNGDKPDLQLGHVGRMIAISLARWTWLTTPTREALKVACHRLVDEHWPCIEAQTEHYAHASPWPLGESLKRPMANIPLIGLLGATMAAEVVNHPKAEALLTRSVHAMQDFFDHFVEQGYSEAVAYDGYMLDFYADLIGLLPAEVQSEKTAHPAVQKILAASWETAVAGDAMNVAELGDVEPAQMTFHLSAHAKLLQMKENSASRWHLGRCDTRRLRSDALLAMLAARVDGSNQSDQGELVTEACRSQNAVVLRTGWGADDLTAAFSASRSKAGHMHIDTGSLVLGTQGQWLISDPGYQQYLAKRERVFTLGPGSHNAPVINGIDQEHKGEGKIRVCEKIDQALSHTLIDMKACYNADLLILHQATREAWLLDNLTLVLVDTIRADNLKNIAWSWHGHPLAGWWVEHGVATLQLDQTLLWIATDDHSLAQAQVDRMSGSRGQQTLCLQQQMDAAQQAGVATVVRWWVFNAGASAAQWALVDGSSSLAIAGRMLTRTTT